MNLQLKKSNHSIFKTGKRDEEGKMSRPVLEKELPFIKVDVETAKRFENFLVEVMRESYGKYLGGALTVSYMGSPGVLFYIDDDSGPLLEVLILYSDYGVKYRISPLRAGVGSALVERVSSLIESAVRFFAETGGYGMAYFVFVPGRQLVPPRTESRMHRALQTLFLSNLVFIFAISMVLSYAVFALVRDYAPIVLILMQLPIMLLSYKLVPFVMGDWAIDSAHRNVYLVGLRMPLGRYQEVLQKVIMPKRFEIKRRLYSSSIEHGVEIDEQQVKSILVEYGLSPDMYEVEVRKIDLYGLVERVAKNFGMRKLPKIYLSNIVVPNAAASGVGASLSSILVTTGLLSRLDEDEVEAVVGHELSHLKRHDVLTFFVLSSAEYLSRVYLALRYWPIFATPLGLLYLWFSLTLLFFIAKFVEARADIDSAVFTGKPDKLASALRKIGLRHLYVEGQWSGRLAAWLRWDPHPPLLFRVEKLAGMAKGGTIRNIWKEAMSSCVSDFLTTLRHALGWRST